LTDVVEDPGAAATVHPAGRWRPITAWVLIGVTAVLTLVSTLTIWAKSQLLDTENFVQTSTNVIANPDVQDALSVYLVDQLYAKVDVAGALRNILPDGASVLAGPAAGALRDLAYRETKTFVASPQFQTLWATASRAAHDQLITILEGGGPVVSTQGGVVTLNLNTALQQIADRLGVGQQLAQRIPPDAGQLVILRSDQLQSMQDGFKLFKQLSVALGLLVLALWAVAVYLASGWRRTALAAIGWTLIGVSLISLVVRRLAGNYLVNVLSGSAETKPVVNTTWLISTQLLADLAFFFLAVGAVVILGTWLAGPSRPATAARRAAAPTLRDRPALYYLGVGLVIVLLVLWAPTNTVVQSLVVALAAVLAVVGAELLRRQAIAEQVA
jgi:hypothetical protein